MFPRQRCVCPPSEYYGIPRRYRTPAVCNAMRAVVYATVTGILAAILTLITIRFVNVDDLFESTLLILLTSALWYRTWRWIRAARQAHTQ